ncbi:GNAT family N-acetyltransferase [Acinetobacter rudis]|uniref:N-acetyltransferase domain-containing protein n=1 Tax=Acinetobacter rudis CIP 110305 TaxID=421052 RepID=S3NJM4_9GAMM|nr:GNAT family N-acetyltransferase [Acinetobacter rudis]EPF74519.1 hypothetical protein F945_01558 [Acinetobacter rudis CIP 110305]
MEIVKLADFPQYLLVAATWFAEKWQLPVEIYQESIQQSIAEKIGIPQWYIVVDTEQRIVAGCGVIDNDFHERTDLTPNLCALFVEDEYRGKNIAKQLLDAVREDFAKMNIEKLYLITDHEHFYEKCGWQFLTMVKEESGEQIRMYEAQTSLT